MTDPFEGERAAKRGRHGTRRSVCTWIRQLKISEVRSAPPNPSGQTRSQQRAQGFRQPWETKHAPSVRTRGLSVVYEPRPMCYREEKPDILHRNRHLDQVGGVTA